MPCAAAAFVFAAARQVYFIPYDKFTRIDEAATWYFEYATPSLKRDSLSPPPNDQPAPFPEPAALSSYARRAL